MSTLAKTLVREGVEHAEVDTAHVAKNQRRVRYKISFGEILERFKSLTEDFRF